MYATQKSPVTKNRKITLYKDNVTAALSLPFPEDKFKVNSTDFSILLDFSKDYILEHAARRVDLFFYTLIAFYNTHALPSQGETKFQHGVGRKQKKKFLTHACHSSFFPSFKTSNNILEGTHFFDTLNSTIELPTSVNYFDSELEGKIDHPSSCRKKCLEIIHLVSMGKLNPINGLNEFLQLMNQIFQDIESNKSLTKNGEPYLVRKTSASPPHIKNTVFQLQKKGTLDKKWTNEKNNVDMEYIEMLLRLTQKEKQACQINLKTRQRIYLKKFKNIQNEIRSSKSTFTP